MASNFNGDDIACSVKGANVRLTQGKISYDFWFDPDEWEAEVVLHSDNANVVQIIFPRALRSS